jgi:hypothetical protein
MWDGVPTEIDPTIAAVSSLLVGMSIIVLGVVSLLSGGSIGRENERLDSCKLARRRSKRHRKMKGERECRLSWSLNCYLGPSTRMISSRCESSTIPRAAPRHVAEDGAGESARIELRRAVH